MGNFAIDKSFLIAGLLESALWGMYTIVFLGFLYVLKFQRSHKPKTFTVVNCAAFLLYLLATTHYALAFRRLIEGFIIYRDTITPPVYYSQYSGVRINLNTAKEAIYITAQVIGDSVVVWRVNALYGRRYFWVTMVPAILILLTALGGYISLGLQRHPTPQNLHVIPSLASMLFFCSFLTNTITTLLLAGRIFFLSRQTSRALNLSSSGSGAGRFLPVVIVILESGFIIAAFKIIEFALYRVAPTNGAKGGNNALYIVFDSTVQVVGMVPTLMIILVLTGFTSVSSRSSPLHHQSSTTRQKSMGTMQFHTPTRNPHSIGTGTGSSTDYASGKMRRGDSNEPGVLSGDRERKEVDGMEMEEHLQVVSDGHGAV